jgi:hypothetical protein
MDPRNKSKTPAQNPWTGLPEEFSFKVLSALEKEFTERVKKGEFIVEGKIFQDEILIRIGYIESGRLRQMNFEASIDFDRDKSTALDNFYICIDCLGVWIRDSFKNLDHDESLDLPISWRATDFQGQTVFLQYSSVNSRLEQEANRLLGIANQALFNEAQAAEDAFDLAETDIDLTSEQAAERLKDLLGYLPEDQESGEALQESLQEPLRKPLRKPLSRERH